MTDRHRTAFWGAAFGAVLFCVCVVRAAENPVTLVDDYVGREPDAPWRKTAAERIEKYRKGDLTVMVQDSDGKAVEGAKVAVRMKRHAFWFGSRVDVKLINSDTEDARKYRESLLELFNYATVNTVYYSQWRTPQLSQRTLSETLKALPWLEGHGYPMRGHTLVWWFKDDTINKSNEEIYARVVRHIDETAGNRRLAEAFDEWDVQNEPFSNSDIFRKLGREKLPDFFRMVHKYDPTATLYLNECHLISQLHQKDWKQRQDFTYDLVKELIDKGTPIGGLGFQGHNVQRLSPIPDIIKIMDRFAKLGLDMEVTEFDIKLRPSPDGKDWQSRWRAPSPTTPQLEQLEGEYTRDYLTAVFSQPRMKAFIMWGFWDGRHWMYNGPIYRKDWSLKPSGRAYKDLVLRDWWTNVDGETDKDGRFGTRGFLGDYEISVEREGRKKTVMANLVRDGVTVEVVID